MTPSFSLTSRRLHSLVILAVLCVLSPAVVGVEAGCLDVDGDGNRNATTDGSLFVRHLFGFSGPALTRDALAPEATRDAVRIAAHLSRCREYLDVDGNGTADALSDGLLVLRYLSGHRGTALTQDVLAPGATRTDPTDIVDWLSLDSLNQIALGPMAGAQITAYRLTSLDTPVEGPLTADPSTSDLDKAGTFALALPGIPDDEWILVAAAGGQDIDADNDGLVDTTPTQNQGEIYALATATEWRNGGLKITALTDMAWRFTRSLVGVVSPTELHIRLDELARAFILQDINLDGVVDRHDLHALVPQDPAHLARLNFDYEIFSTADGQGQSVIGAHHAGDQELLEQLLERLFGHALNLWPGRDGRYEQVKVEVSLFGRGTVTADQGGLSVDSEADPDVNVSSIWVAQDAAATLTLTAMPIAETEILGWNGCDRVTSDLTQCIVSLDRGHQVTAKFGYIETMVSAPVHDLSGATVVLEPARANLTIPAAEADLVEALRQLEIGDFIVGPTSSGGYLRRVTDFARINDFTYQLTTEDASLADVITQGSGGFQKRLTNGDLLGYTPPSGAIPRARVATGAFSGLEGVTLIPSDDPNEASIRLRLGSSATGAPQPRYGTKSSTDLAVTLWESGDQKLTAQGVITLDINVDFDFSYGFFSGKGLEDFVFIIDVKQTDELKLTYEGVERHGEFEKEIGTIHFGSYLFLVGPVPVYVLPEVKITVGADLVLKGSISFGFKVQKQDRVGVLYKKGVTGWKRINESRPPSATFDNAPAVNLEAQAKLYVRAGLAALVYGVAGPQAGADVYALAAAAAPVYNEDLITGEGCKDGLEASLKAGINGFVKWEVSDGFKLLSGLSSLPNFEASLLKFEWLLWHAYLTGQCAGDPPFLKVEGDDIYETIAFADRDQKIEEKYLVKNVGSGKLPWKVGFFEDNAVTVTPTSGQLVAEEFAYVDFTLDTNLLDTGLYRNKLSFENTFVSGALQSYQPLGSGVRHIYVEILPEVTNTPIIDRVESTGSGFARVHWTFDQPSTAELWGYQIEVTQDPTGTTGWSMLATVADIDASSRVVSGLPVGDLCFRMHAYAGSSIRSPDSALECINLVPGPNQLGIELGSGTSLQENGSTTGTASRVGDTSAALSVLLANSNSSAATVPGLVTIPAGETSADFPLTPIDNAVADGDKELTLTASAADFESSTLDVTITDDEIAGLTLRVANAGIDESGGTTSATVSHNGDKGSPLTVDLISSIPGQATLPNRVTIPAGQDGVDFEISAVDDSEQDGDQALTLTASAAGYADGTARIIVTDDDTHTGRRLVLDRVVLSKVYGPSDLCPPADAGASGVCIEYSRYASGYQLDDRYTHSEGSGSYRFQEVYVATGWVATDYEVTVTYDSPPTTLIPGEPIPTLHASGTSSGYTDGWYLSTSFTYYVKSGTRNNYFFDSQVWLLNRNLPYDENTGVFSGTETKSTMTDITVPQSAGDGYTIGGKFNWDPGLYIDWIYKLAE